MKQAKAERLILAKWDRWVTEEGINNPTDLDALVLFSYLTEKADPSLDFRYSGDKWQCVKAWLRRAGEVRTRGAPS